uniref:ABC transporter ATP-binding protein n=1 Tax=Euzebya sp. TaxID=1971409 RepID=UPI0035192F64
PLEAVGLRKSYGRRLAVAGIDLTIRPGESVGLLGPNGAGKTTTVKMLLGLVHPDAGHARLFGVDASDPRAGTGVGYLPETFAQPVWATGRPVLATHARLAGVDPAGFDGAIDHAIHTVGLAGRGDDKVGGYSKGMRQRLGLAAALLGDPGLIILDEPTSAMDPIGRREVRDVVRDLAAGGTAVLLNSHLLSEVEAVCDRIVVMHRGRVLADRPVQSLPTGGEVRITADALTDAHLAIVEGHGVVGHRDDRSAVVVLDDADALPELVAALVGAGAAIRAVVPLQSSLEELFIRLVDADDLDTAAQDAAARDTRAGEGAGR